MSDEAQAVPAVRRILLVEDEILICLLIETILIDAGYVLEIANSIEEALAAIDRGTFAGAILDLNLKGKKVFPVADRLVALGTPFLFATGGGRDVEDYPDRPWVGKPFQEFELLAAVDALMA